MAKKSDELEFQPEVEESTQEAIVIEDFQKSRKRTSLKEFAVSKNMRPEIKAGFKAWLGDRLHNFDEDWEKLLHQYENRKLSKED